MRRLALVILVTFCVGCASANVYTRPDGSVERIESKSAARSLWIYDPATGLLIHHQPMSASFENVLSALGGAILGALTRFLPMRWKPKPPEDPPPVPV